jgi:protein phosphatase
MSIALRYAARSDVGLVRANNQDSGYAGPDLLAVADGMGGHAGGDIASSIAIASLVGLDGAEHSPEQALDDLAAAIDAARREIIERSAAQPQLSGMGTTVTALLRAGNKLVMAHLGDSRAYLLRDDELSQVTTDHTFVQHLVDTGRIAPEDAETHPQRNVVMRVLGDFEVDLSPDLSVREAQPGDRWLLCSDGLSGFVSAETIAQILISVVDPGDCAETLVQLALRAGSTDNVTCVVADVIDTDPTPTELTDLPTAATVAVGAADPTDDPASSDADHPDEVGVRSTEGGAVDSTGTENTENTAETASSADTAATRALDVVPAAVPPVELQTAPQVVGSAIEDPTALAAIVAATSGRTSAHRLLAGPDATDDGDPTSEGETATVAAKDVKGSDAPGAADASPSATGAGGPGPGPSDDSDQPHRTRHGVLRITSTLVLVLALLGGGYAAYGWTQDQYFVGVSNGQVAVFQGVPQHLGPLTLSSPVELTGTSVDSLPSYVQDRLHASIPASSLVDARLRARDLLDQSIPPTTTAPATLAPTAPATAPATTAPTTAPTTPPKSTPAHTPAHPPTHAVTHGPATKGGGK